MNPIVGQTAISHIVEKVLMFPLNIFNDRISIKTYQRYVLALQFPTITVENASSSRSANHYGGAEN
jgi:hypothetical protein